MGWPCRLVFTGETDPATLPKKGGVVAASNKAIHECAHCGLWYAKTSQCSKCKAVRYCGRGCQMRAWAQGHKEACKLLVAQAKAEAKAKAEPKAEAQVVAEAKLQPTPAKLQPEPQSE